MAFEVKPWKPFRELATLREDMDRMWNRFLGEWPSLEPFGGEWAPSLDVSETKEDIVVKAEVPGIDAKDIDISLSNDLLTIKGKKEQEKEEKEENYHRVERSYGSFSRSIRLPGRSTVTRSRPVTRTASSRSRFPRPRRPKRSRSKWSKADLFPLPDESQSSTGMLYAG